MKSIWREIVMAVIMGMILPGIVMNWTVEEETPPAPGDQATEPTRAEQIRKVRLEMKLRQSDGSLQTMDMDEYLVGVVLAEMPASFEPEAKKAQAVAARTFTRKAWITGGKHRDGSVCTDSTCCQAYCPAETYLKQGGSEEAVLLAREAVEATSGYVLTYGGSLIEATYFSCSGGVTEDAEAVWGTDYPYLRSVDSPGEEGAAHYTDVVTFSRSQLMDKLGLTLGENPESWFGAVRYTSGGGVDTMVIGGKTFTGTQLRFLLGLRSTAFTVEPEGEGVILRTRGFGHRVGMSQYGADAMAVTGSTWQEILAHYYTGASLELTNDHG